MAHGHHNENLDIPMQNQSRRLVKTLSEYCAARLVLFIGTYFVILGAFGHEIADLLAFVVAIFLILLCTREGMKLGKVKSARLRVRHAIPLLIGSLGFIITGTRAELQSNEAGNIQNCMCSITAATNASELHDNALFKVVAVFILAVVTTIGVAVAGSWIVFNLPSPFRATPTAAPAIQAIPAAPVQALPVIPVVQGLDMDDVLARAPVPTRLNSPLSWL